MGAVSERAWQLGRPDVSLPARPGEARVAVFGGHRPVDVDVDPLVGVTLGGVDGLGVPVVDTWVDIPLRQDDFNSVVVTSEGEPTCPGIDRANGSGLAIAEVGMGVPVGPDHDPIPHLKRPSYPSGYPRPVRSGGLRFACGFVRGGSTPRRRCGGRPACEPPRRHEPWCRSTRLRPWPTSCPDAHIRCGPDRLRCNRTPLGLPVRSGAGGEPVGRLRFVVAG